MRAWHQNFKRAPAAERTIDGITFHSKAEMNRWLQLRVMEKQGMIRNLQRQVKHELVLPNGVPILSEKGRTCFYTSDFEYEVNVSAVQWNMPGTIDVWGEVIEDVKGFADPLSRFRIAVFEAISGKKVHIVKV